MAAFDRIREENPLPFLLGEQRVFHASSKPHDAEEYFLFAVTIQIDLVFLGPLVFAQAPSRVPGAQGLVRDGLRMFPAIRFRVFRIDWLPDQQERKHD